MGYGDEILAAGQAQQLFNGDGRPSVIVDYLGHPRRHPIWDGNPAIIQGVLGTAGLRTITNGPNCRPYIIYPFTEDTGWTFNQAFRARDHIAKIYLTDDELTIGRACRLAYGTYVLVDPWSKHENLRWPLDRWQTLVDRFVGTRVTIVQQWWGDAPRLYNVGYVRTDSFRAACSALAGATLYVRGESGMCHAAAALGVPNVVIWGGCMDWNVLGGYPKQLGVGVGDQPCGRWRPCPHCKLAMAAVSVDDVERAIYDQLACYPPSV